jgi:hypothetical protein
MENLRDLSQQFSVEGRIEAIVLRPDRQAPALLVDQVEAVPGYGLMGDRRSHKERTTESSRKREITLIQAEHIPLIARWAGLTQLSPLELTFCLYDRPFPISHCAGKLVSKSNWKSLGHAILVPAWSAI